MLETGVALPASGVSTEYPYFVVIRISLNTAGTKGRTKDKGQFERLLVHCI